METGEFVCIRTYSNRTEAELARGLLEAHQIAAQVLADDAGGMHPHLLTGTGGARLLVKESQAKKALEVLQAP